VPSRNPAREGSPRIHIEDSTARTICWLRRLSGLPSANLLGVFLRSRMIIRVIIVAIIVLAIMPRTRPILFRTLGNIARATAAVLMVIWATSLGSGRRGW